MSKFQIRGVIEGFYGRPWSWPERQRMVEFMGAYGYNLYVYAPKNDPIHRNRWQEPYLPEELERFGALAKHCERLGIEFVFGISPLQFHYSSEEYFERFWQRLLPVYNLGIRSFALLVDDMPEKFHHADDEEKFKSIADAQVWLNNTVYEKLQQQGGVGKVLFCPTEYAGEGVSDYLKTLGEGLNPAIEVFWTGPEICSPKFTTEDARRISETLKRPVLYWDNYPVNDLEMRFRPHIRPVRGREGDLYTACKGIVANGSLQPENCKIALHTYAQYFADPEHYEPEAAWKRALLDLTGNHEDAAAVAILADMARWSHLERGKNLHNQMAPKLARFWQAWGGVPKEAGPDLPDAPPAPEGEPAKVAETRAERERLINDLIAEFTLLRAAATRIQTVLANPYLKADLAVWADKLSGWTDTAIYALTALRHALIDPEGHMVEVFRVQALDRLLATRENFAWVSGDLIDQFARRCLWAASALAAKR